MNHSFWITFVFKIKCQVVEDLICIIINVKHYKSTNYNKVNLLCQCRVTALITVHVTTRGNKNMY